MLKHLLPSMLVLCCAYNAIGQSLQLPANRTHVSFVSESTPRIQELQNRLTTILVQDYNAGVWENTDSIIYVYDPAYPRYHNNFDFAEFTNFQYEPDYSVFEWMTKEVGGWEGYYRQYGNFDAEGIRTSINIDSWDGVGYVGDSRVEYYYTAEGDVDTILYLNYDGDYEPYQQFIYTYSDDRLANIVEQSYGVDWQNSLLTIYTYTAEGRIDNIVYRGWDGIGWFDQSRNIYSYDGEGNLTEKLFQLYDFGWETYGRYIYAYDGSGFNISIESQAYDGVEYTSYQKWEFTEYADGLPSMNTISQWDGFIWVDYFRALFYYESYDDGNVDIVNNASQFALEIYPNPAADVFTISFESAGSELINLQVTNITGQTVLHQTIESAPGLNKIQYPIQTNWAPGVYQVSLTQGGTRGQRSLVVE